MSCPGCTFCAPPAHAVTAKPGRHRGSTTYAEGPTSYEGRHAAWTTIVNPTPAQVAVMFEDGPS